MIHDVRNSDWPQLLKETRRFDAQYKLSVESNQNVESKRQSVESKMEKMRSLTFGILSFTFKTMAIYNS